MANLTPFRAWDPFRTLLPIPQEFYGDDPEGLSRFFDGKRNRNWDWTPRFDVVEQPEAYLFRAELPGMKAEDIDVTLTGDRLTIRGEKRQDEVREDDHYRISERSWGAFERSFTIPSAVDTNSLDAELKDGVLDIKVAKTNEGKPSRVKVKSS